MRKWQQRTVLEREPVRKTCQKEERTAVPKSLREEAGHSPRAFPCSGLPRITRAENSTHGGRFILLG